MKSEITQLGTCEQSEGACREDFLLAAEAVVDAALICRQENGSWVVSEKKRQELIESVFSTPRLTESLFLG